MALIKFSCVSSLIVFTYIYILFPIGSSKVARLSEICGNVKAVNKIVGGNAAGIGQFPWMARLEYEDPKSGKNFFRCGGSLIAPRYVLTAAHCTHGTMKKIIRSVRLGEYDAQTDPDCIEDVCAPKVQDIAIEKVFTHNRYNPRSQLHDIAILKLNKPAVLHDYVMPVCLPTENSDRRNFTLRRVVAAGWGETNSTSKDIPDVLRYVSLPIEFPQVCKNTFVLPFQRTQICVGAGKGKDTCVGDSGGPVMVPMASKKGPARFYQLGIVSYGAPTCGTDAAVYTNVSHYLDWIYGLMNM